MQRVLFTVYISEIVSIMCLYAEDTVLYFVVDSVRLATQTRIVTWHLDFEQYLDNHYLLFKISIQ